MMKKAQVMGMAAMLLLASLQAAYAETPGSAPTSRYLKDGTIAYAMTSLRWATYLKPDARVDCPEGVNDGPREQFAALFPDDGKPRVLADTQLRREIQNWFPTTRPDYFPFREPGGTQALGLDLDGKVGPEDFTGLDGQPGIDNQMYRALGCVNSHRDAQGINDSLNSGEIVSQEYNRTLVELNGVDDLANDDEVEVVFYRGLDALHTDAGGKEILPGGTQRVDARWGRKYIQRLDGKIVDGVLTTEPSDLFIPWAVFNLPADEYVRDARLRLTLSPTRAEGLIAGFTDVESWHLQMMKSQSTHCQSYGQQSAMSLYKAMRRLADAYPDPQTGANTAISSALRTTFTQVFILPESKSGLAGSGPLPRATPYGGTPYPRTPDEESADFPGLAVAASEP
jgi:hypothetical protein